MRTHCWLLAIVVGLALVAGAVSAQPPDDRVPQLIRQLGSDQFSEREAAVVALDSIGTPALPALQQALRSEDPEVRRRARLLITRIEKRVEASQLLAPRRVHLIYQDTPVSAAVADFARKTGFPILLQGDTSKLSNRKVTLNTGEVPFWEAFTQFCTAAGLSERGSTQPALNSAIAKDDPKQIIVKQVILRHRVYGSQPVDNRLLLNDGKPLLLPMVSAGALRVRALPASALTNSDGETSFTLDVTPEPSLICHGIVDIRIDRAIDEHGQVLAQPAAWGGTHVQTSGDVMMINGVAIWEGDEEMPASNPRQMPVRLRTAKQASKLLKEVRGTLATKVQTAPQPVLTVNNILHAAGKTVRSDEAGSLKVHEATRLNNGFLRLRVRLESLSPNLPNGLGRVFRVNGQGMVRVIRAGQEVPGSTGSELRLLDAKGQELQLVSNSNTQSDFNINGVVAQELDLTFKSQPGQGEPAKLVLMGRRTVALEVPFTLKNVPLP